MVEISANSSGTSGVKSIGKIFQFCLELCNLGLSYLSKFQLYIGQRNIHNLNDNINYKLSFKIKANCLLYSPHFTIKVVMNWRAPTPAHRTWTTRLLREKNRSGGRSLATVHPI